MAFKTRVLSILDAVLGSAMYLAIASTIVACIVLAMPSMNRPNRDKEAADQLRNFLWSAVANSEISNASAPNGETSGTRYLASGINEPVLVCSGLPGRVVIRAAGFIKRDVHVLCAHGTVMLVVIGSAFAYGAAASDHGLCIKIGHTETGVTNKNPNCSATNRDWGAVLSEPVVRSALPMAASLGSLN